jgi:hypothetical protein
LNKKHNALAHHRVREMISAKIMGYYWIDDKKDSSRYCQQTLELFSSMAITETTSFLFWKFI